ncbi:MAG: PAAR domain-containing protein [Burkholderiaceae bacterium]
MATRYYITLGASTTAGGPVTSASSLLALDGVKVALEGDQVSCPVCGTTGIIGLDGPRLPARRDGRQYALDGDLCLCRCDPPPRLVAVQHLCGQ